MSVLKANLITLEKQSRSFAIPIKALNPKLRNPILAQYNVNKTLDTIEDAYLIDVAERKIVLQELYEIIINQLQTPDIFKNIEILNKIPVEEQFVFTNFNDTLTLFHSLNHEEQQLGQVCLEDTLTGMINFLGQPIHDFNELNQYCDHVAGSVGIYLTDLVKLHYPDYFDNIKQDIIPLALGFGCFLQKLNIIRDYHEDVTKRGVSFWPLTLDINQSPEKALQALCQETLTNDVPQAIAYYQLLADVEISFRNFLRFILYSGLKYLELLANKKSFFNTTKKIKLPKIFIQTLYAKQSKLSEADFLCQCEKLC